uniref:Uncharacterized protein n=1 Tax=Anguilla anguilla TaxID=7936 RepID=A0A0E9XJR8_ANGAN
MSNAPQAVDCRVILMQPNKACLAVLAKCVTEQKKTDIKQRRQCCGPNKFTEPTGKL